MGISHPAKNSNKLGQVWQNIVVKSDFHGQKENDRIIQIQEALWRN